MLDVHHDKKFLALRANIDATVTRYSGKDDITMVVMIGTDGMPHYKIYLYSSKNILKANGGDLVTADGKSMMLYTCMCCVFADWVQGELIEFAERMPRMYRSVRKLRLYNENFRTDDSGEWESRIRRIAGKTERFVNVLFNFITIQSYGARDDGSLDTSLLQSLLSLNMLLNYVLVYADEMDVDTIVTEILRAVNAMQKFEAYNCDVLSSYYDNKYFFGYSMAKPNTHQLRVDVDAFLADIEWFELETQLERCTVPQMLLGTVLLTSGDVVSVELQQVILVVEYRRVVINSMFKEVEKSNNLDIVYWYMEIVLDAIIRLICEKTVRVLTHDRVLSTEIMEGFKILSFLFTGLTIDTAELVNGFNRLASNQELTRAEREALKLAMKNYVVRRKGYETDFLPYYNIEKLRLDEKLTGSSLEEFMDAIINRVSDYKCFVNIFELLKVEHKKYYLPQKRSPYKVFQFVFSHILKIYENNDQSSKPYKVFTEVQFGQMLNTDKINDKMCEFIINVYQYILESCIVLNDNTKKYEDTKQNNFEEVSNIMFCILTIFENIRDYKILDRYLAGLLFEIIPVLETQRNQKTDWKNENYSVLIRMLYVIMIELNNYGLEACKSENYEFLFFNNINYDTTGKQSINNKNIISQLSKLGLEKNSTQERYSHGLFNKIKEDYNLGRYSRDIRLYWRGELKTIYGIYENVQYDVLNPCYVYALYDIYIKFLIATLYCELSIITENLQWNYAFIDSDMVNMNEYFGNLKKIKEIPRNILPDKFNTFVVNFNLYLLDLFNKLCSNFNNFETPNTTNIENTIRELGIAIDLKLPKRNPLYSMQIKLLEKDLLVKTSDASSAINKYSHVFQNSINEINYAYEELKKLITFYKEINQFSILKQ